MGLAVHEGKWETYFVETFQIRPDNYTFDIVNEFIYIGSAVTTKHDVSLRSSTESLLSTSTTMVSIGNLIKKKDFSRTIKLILYKTLILPVLLYGAEAWTLLSTDAASLSIREKKSYVRSSV